MSGTATLAARLMAQCPGTMLRAQCDADLPFLADLYASTRESELAHVPWSASEKRRFLDAQFGLQRSHYAAHYLGAEFLVVERDGESAGRLYLHEGADEIRLMEIALVPALRGHGLGGILITALMRIAGAEGREITLHVEPNNPALRLYHRLGFRVIEQHGVYLFLGWRPDALPLRAAS